MHMAAPGYLERDINSVQDVADILLFVQFASTLVKIDKLYYWLLCFKLLTSQAARGIMWVDISLQECIFSFP